jgi:homoserine kinase type II
VAVYTEITRTQLEDFFDAYALGRVVSFEGIKDGIENTNYRVTTSHGDFVLTLFEALTDKDLNHIIGLLAYLSINRLPCPTPQPDRLNRLLRQLNNKPAAVFKCLSGSAVNAASIAQCEVIGEQLARLHVVTQTIELPFKNTNDLSACKAMFNKINGVLSIADTELIDDEFGYQAQYNWSELPLGIIHGDLFKDNALFIGDHFSGMLDFYSVCAGPWLLDVAITANDWCCDDGMVNPKKMAALLAAYNSLRPLQANEQQLWSTALRLAALRFWLSRLQHQIFPRLGAITQQKDPQVFRRILQQHRQPQHTLQVLPTLVPTNANTFTIRKSA